MSSALLSATLFPSRVTSAEDASQRYLQTPKAHQLANRGGLASSSQGRSSCSAASTSDEAAQRRRYMRVRAAATMIEAEVSAPDSAKPSSAGKRDIPNTPLAPFHYASADRFKSAVCRRGGQDHRRLDDARGPRHRGSGSGSSGNIRQLCPGYSGAANSAPEERGSAHSQSFEKSTMQPIHSAGRHACQDPCQSHIDWEGQPAHLTAHDSAP